MTKYIYIFIVLCSFFYCNSDVSQKKVYNELEDSRHAHKLFLDSIFKNSNTAYDNVNCSDPDFSYFFPCNKSEECYQVELSCSLSYLKDDVVISIIYDEGKIIDIVLTRSGLIMPGKNKFRMGKSKKIIFCQNPLTKETFHLSCSKPRKVYTNTDLSELNNFFSKTLWSLYNRDSSYVIDGESWLIKGKKEEKISKWVRISFKDSVYYSNIQKLLDICKVKEYSYHPIKH
jgi:hypothetical protein